MFTTCVLDDTYRISPARNSIFCIPVKTTSAYTCTCWLLEWKILKIIPNTFLNVCTICLFSKRVVASWISTTKSAIGSLSPSMLITQRNNRYQTFWFYYFLCLFNLTMHTTFFKNKITINAITNINTSYIFTRPNLETAFISKCSVSNYLWIILHGSYMIKSLVRTI